MNSQNRKSRLSSGERSEAALIPLHLAWNGFIFTTSKQIALAMTSPLYTKPIERRKPIEFINALVYMFVSAIKERSEHISTTNIAGESGLHHVGRGIRNLTLMPKAWLRRAYENRLPVFKWVGVLYLKQSPKSI